MHSRLFRFLTGGASFVTRSRGHEVTQRQASLNVGSVEGRRRTGQVRFIECSRSGLHLFRLNAQTVSR